MMHQLKTEQKIETDLTNYLANILEVLSIEIKLKDLLLSYQI